MSSERGVRGWLLVSAAAVLGQQSLTAYPDQQLGTHVFWTALSFLLLWFVHRRSLLARSAFIAFATVGFGLFLLATITEPTRASVSLALLCAVQVGTMLVAPVRAWTSCTSGVAAQPGPLAN
jgi:hypothetical protein